MEFLKSIGIAGFIFFLTKGIIWIILFLLLYFKVFNKEKIRKIKNILSFRRKNKKVIEEIE